MSMQTDCIYGYGFSIYATDDQLKSFIVKHSNSISFLSRGRELLEYIETSSNIQLKETFSDWISDVSGVGNTGIYGVVADVMYRETGIPFEYFESQNELCDDAILFTPKYPWEMNNISKSLTLDKLDEIFLSYINDLDGQCKPGYIRMEYFG